MTKFNHQPRKGNRKAPKHRSRVPIGLSDLSAVETHRELEFLRKPTRERALKLDQIQRRLRYER